MIVLKNTDNKINCVMHIADIHIRLQKRHEEYRTVFSRLYDYCKNIKSNNTI